MRGNMTYVMVWKKERLSVPKLALLVGCRTSTSEPWDTVSTISIEVESGEEGMGGKGEGVEKNAIGEAARRRGGGHTTRSQKSRRYGSCCEKHATYNESGTPKEEKKKKTEMRLCCVVQ